MKKHSKADDDIIFEHDEDNETSGLKGKSERKLRAELKQAQQEAKEYLDGWQRAKADLINFKRESEEARRRFIQFATQDLIEELLPVLDSFEAALKHEDSTGIKQVYKLLLSVLAARGVEVLRPEGENFDPHQHDSVESVPVSQKQDDGKVLSVVQTGYRLHDKLIRAPKVNVGEFKA